MDDQTNEQPTTTEETTTVKVEAEQPTAQPANDQEADTTNGPTVEGLQAQLEKMQAENRKLKNENRERRVTEKQAQEQNEKLRKVAQLLGFAAEDDDPEVLVKAAQTEAEQRAKERDELQAKLNRLEENDHLRTLAKKAGANPDVVVPYLRGVGQLPEWGADEYDTTAVKLIADTLTSAPRACGDELGKPSMPKFAASSLQH